jgi:hypothetical protein
LKVCGTVAHPLHGRIAIPPSGHSIVIIPKMPLF